MAIAERVAEFVCSNADVDDAAKLRASLAENGYLYFRGLGPKEKVLGLRRVFLEYAKEAGWLEAGSDVMEARWNGRAGPYAEGDKEYLEVYKKIVNHPLFNELPADPFYMELVQRIVGAPVMLHRMHIGRMSFPKNIEQTTPPHQDWHYIRGTADTFTIWTPLGDTPLEVGGLKVLRGSHRHGFREHALDPVQKFAGWGLKGENLDATGGDEWHTTAYTSGDLVLFHSHTVHSAMPNLTERTIRLSIDNRYQRQGDEFGANATRTHWNL
ncbi:MAG: phytanoyl-CoA dioxygenase family protein [Planctomycetes bacterium]|nr:phytanoyl-CoA dioxygenase family protein [Planctomycetota bacterium]